MNIQTGFRLNSQHFSDLAQSLLASPEIAARAALLAMRCAKCFPAALAPSTCLREAS